MRMISRITGRVDWVMLALALLIAGLGVIVIYSATHGAGSSRANHIHVKQMIWIAAGLTAMLLAASIDYHIMGRCITLLYPALVASLLMVMIIGKLGGGSRRWISLGPVILQPSEFAKIVIVATLAWHFNRSMMKNELRLRDMVLPSAIVAVPALLILKQPDLGTAAMLFLILGVMALTIGVNKKSLFILLTAFILIFPFLWYQVFHDYQRERVIALLNPGADPLGSGYHSLQSKIAVGSGRLLGKGLMAGTQSRLNFLPVRHTDFIFAVLAEETGFVGSALFLLGYLILLYRGLSLACRGTDRFGFLLASGLVASQTLYLFFNVGMTVGITPVVGLPLPLMSYGGSSMVASMISIGLIMNVGMRGARGNGSASRPAMDLA